MIRENFTVDNYLRWCKRLQDKYQQKADSGELTQKEADLQYELSKDDFFMDNAEL